MVIYDVSIQTLLSRCIDVIVVEVASLDFGRLLAGTPTEFRWLCCSTGPRGIIVC